jgi:hypothetical protein
MYLRDSRWSYITAANGGLGAGFIVASGGNIDLADPSGATQSFWYGGIGGGLSVGLKLPKVPKFAIRKVSIGAAGALKAFPSTGKVYMTDAFQGDELAREDLCGMTMFLDGGGGLAAGLGGTAMLLGMDGSGLAATLAHSITSTVGIHIAAIDHAIHRAPALLVMAGVNVGLVAGAGAGGLLGYLR